MIRLVIRLVLGGMILSLVGMLIPTGPARARPYDLYDLKRMADAYEGRGERAAAEVILKNRVQISRTQSDERLDLPNCLHELADFYNNHHRLARAEDTLKLRLVIVSRQAVVGKATRDDLYLASKDLSDLYILTSRYADAEKLIQDFVIDERQRRIEPHLDDPMSYLAIIYEKTGRKSAAESILKERLEVCLALYRSSDGKSGLEEIVSYYEEHHMDAAAEAIISARIKKSLKKNMADKTMRWRTLSGIWPITIGRRANV